GPEGRLAAGAAMGASGTLDFASAGEAERESWVRDLTGGRGADVTIEATGDPAAVRQAMRCTRDAGRVVIAGQYTDRGDVTLNPHTDLNRKHLDVRGCWGSDFSHFHAAVRIMSDPERARPWSRLKLATYGLGGLDEALEAVERGRVVKALVDPAEEDAAG
ncbi:MAG: zinc-binding dehydrogenase, partial [Gemmatimonadota bacterium]